MRNFLMKNAQIFSVLVRITTIFSAMVAPAIEGAGLQSLECDFSQDMCSWKIRHGQWKRLEVNKITDVSTPNVNAMQKVEDIKQKRQSQFILNRLKKGKQLEKERDLKEVRRDLTLIKSPAASKVKMEQQLMEVVEENSEEEMEENT